MFKCIFGGWGETGNFESRERGGGGNSTQLKLLDTQFKKYQSVMVPNCQILIWSSGHLQIFNIYKLGNFSKPPFLFSNNLMPSDVNQTKICERDTLTVNFIYTTKLGACMEWLAVHVQHVHFVFLRRIASIKGNEDFYTLLN